MAEILGQSGCREILTSCPYVIRYRVSGDSVIILRIRHMAGDTARDGA